MTSPPILWIDRPGIYGGRQSGRPQRKAGVQPQARTMGASASRPPENREGRDRTPTGLRLDRASVTDRPFALELRGAHEPVAVLEERDRPVALRAGPGHLSAGAG